MCPVIGVFVGGVVAEAPWFVRHSASGSGSPLYIKRKLVSTRAVQSGFHKLRRLRARMNPPSSEAATSIDSVRVSGTIVVRFRPHRRPIRSISSMMISFSSTPNSRPSARLFSAPAW